MQICCGVQVIPAAPKGLEIRHLNFDGLREGMRKLSKSKAPVGS